MKRYFIAALVALTACTGGNVYAQKAAPKATTKTTPKATVKPAAKPTAKPVAKPAVKPAAGKLPVGVVATVSGVPVKQTEVDARLWSEYGSQMIDRYVNQEIIRQEAKKRGISATAAEINAKVDEAKASFSQYPGRQANEWDEFIKRYGMANLKQDMEIQVLVTKIGENEAKKTVLTADEQKQVKETLERDAHQINAKHILVGMGDQFAGRTEEQARARMKEVTDKLAAGSKWEDLAKEYSDDSSNKDKGGDLGFFTKQRMVKEFEDAAFALKDGETTKEPVKTAFGLHLIQMIAHKDTPVTPEQVKTATDERLNQKKENSKDARTWFPTLRDKYKVVVKPEYAPPAN